MPDPKTIGIMRRLLNNECPTNKLFQIKLDEDKLYIAIVEPDEIQNFVVYDILCKII